MTMKFRSLLCARLFGGALTAADSISCSVSKRLRSLQDEGIYSYIPVGEICERIDRLQEYAALPMPENPFAP